MNLLVKKQLQSFPGIGKVLGGVLEKQGFDKAYAVLVQFLALGKKNEKFKTWLHDTCGG